MNVQTITHKHTNMYLINENDRYLLFDCGWQDSFSVIKAALREKKIGFEQLVGVLISHFHPDHAGTAELLRRHGVKPLILEHQVPYIPWLNEFFSKSKNDPRGNYAPLDVDNIEPINLEEAGKVLSDNGINGEVLYTPGHSDDSISLIIGSSAFVGDFKSYDNPALWNKLRERNVKIIYAGHHVSRLQEG